MEKRMFSNRTADRYYHKSHWWKSRCLSRTVALPRPAGFLLRFSAYALDIMCCSVFFAVFLFFWLDQLSLGAIHGAVLFFALYKPAMELTFGATVGKMMMHQGVVTGDGRMIGPWAAFVRNICFLIFTLSPVVLRIFYQNYLPDQVSGRVAIFFGILFFVDVLVMVVHPRKRALHDLLAGTHCCEEMVSTMRISLARRLRTKRFESPLRRTYIAAPE